MKKVVTVEAKNADDLLNDAYSTLYYQVDAIFDLVKKSGEKNIFPRQ